MKSKIYSVINNGKVFFILILLLFSCGKKQEKDLLIDTFLNCEQQITNVTQIYSNEKDFDKAVKKLSIFLAKKENHEVLTFFKKRQIEKIESVSEIFLLAMINENVCSFYGVTLFKYHKIIVFIEQAYDYEMCKTKGINIYKGTTPVFKLYLKEEL